MYAPLALAQFVRVLADQLSVIVWLVPAGLIVCAARRQLDAVALLTIVLVGVPFAMGLLAPQRLKPDNVRYVPQLVAMAAVLAFTALGPLVQRTGWRRGGVLVVTVAVAVIGANTLTRTSEFALSVKNIEQLHVSLGRWLRDHLPQGSTVATNDVGALAYFSGHRILDIEGLVTPRALDYRQRPERGLAFVRDTRPDFVVIFPHWYPELTRHPELFTEVHRAVIPDNLVSAGDTFIVYQTIWARQPVIPRSEPAPQTP
jgi:hypothetical protein